MQLLVIDAQNAPEVYREAGKELKKVMEKTFGKDLLSKKVTDRIKSFEDACKELGISQKVFNERTEHDGPDEIAYKKMKLITMALNEGWQPNWDDSNERKWRPWFYLDNPSGFRFYVSGYDYSYSYSAGGSHLCFKSEELCNYAAKQFLDIYKDLFN